MENLEELLMNAIHNNDFKCLKHCLSKGVSSNKISSKGTTPLGVAVMKGNFNIVKTLAEYQRGIINKRTNNNSFERNVSNSDFTISKGRNQNMGYYVVYKDTEDADFGESQTPDGMDQLEWDMEVDNTEDNPATPPEARIYKWYADVLNKTAVVLESPDNDIARLDKFGYNVLHYAIKTHHCNIAEYLIDNFKEISVNQSDCKLNSPLQLAVLADNDDMVKLLLTKGALVNYPNHKKRTALHYAALRGYINIVHILLDNGANINAQDFQDCTPLSLAIDKEEEQVAKLLIQKGTRLNHEEVGEKTVLYKAVRNNMTDVVQMLLDFGGKIRQSHCLLHIAIRHGNFDMLKMLHKGGAFLNIRDKDGRTALMIACIYKNFDIFKYLLDNGATASHGNEFYDLSAMYICVNTMNDSNMFRSYAELLLAHDVNINAYNFAGPALFYAIVQENIAAACDLIKFGADVNVLSRGIQLTDNLRAATHTRNFYLIQLLIYAGFNIHSSHLDYFDKEALLYDPISQFLAKCLTNPLSLKELSRIAIRKLLSTKCIRYSISELPIPTVLHRYLALDDL